MRLRPLKLKDAELMLEWMHDKDVTEHLKGKFQQKTITDCKEFITNSWTDEFNSHFAIVKNDDIYLGTVSLKNIEDDTAEFAISIRKEAMGKGYAQMAMKQIIQHGFEVLKLKEIYWYVSKDNLRAIKFYEKSGYHAGEYPAIFMERQIICSSQMPIENYYWYVVKQ